MQLGKSRSDVHELRNRLEVAMRSQCAASGLLSDGRGLNAA
jgi:hypothetical protein